MSKLMFTSVEQAVAVLGKYRVIDKLAAVERLGYTLADYTHAELAEFVCASREKVTVALGKRRAARALAVVSS